MLIDKIWSFDKTEQLKVMVLMWRWWSARKKANQGRKMLTAAEIQSSVLYYLSEFERLNTTNQFMPKTIKGFWRPPPNDIYKINVDGAFYSDARTGGWGAVIRDRSDVLAAGAGNISYAASAVQTEAIAAYKGLQLAAQMGMINIMLETDATLLAMGLNSEQIDRSPIGCIVRQIRDFMRSEFSSCFVSVCSRCCNKVADCLATHGACVMGSGSAMFWNQAPEFVAHLVSGDLPKSEV